MRWWKREWLSQDDEREADRLSHPMLMVTWLWLSSSRMCDDNWKRRRKHEKFDKKQRRRNCLQWRMEVFATKLLNEQVMMLNEEMKSRWTPTPYVSSIESYVTDRHRHLLTFFSFYFYYLDLLFHFDEEEDNWCHTHSPHPVTPGRRCYTRDIAVFD